MQGRIFPTSSRVSEAGLSTRLFPWPSTSDSHVFLKVGNLSIYSLLRLNLAVASATSAPSTAAPLCCCSSESILALANSSVTILSVIIKVKAKVFTFTSRSFQPKAGLPRGGGVKETLYLWSNRWDSNLGPFGPHAHALSTWPQCHRKMLQPEGNHHVRGRAAAIGCVCLHVVIKIDPVVLLSQPNLGNDVWYQESQMYDIPAVHSIPPNGHNSYFINLFLSGFLSGAPYLPVYPIRLNIPTCRYAPCFRVSARPLFQRLNDTLHGTIHSKAY